MSTKGRLWAAPTKKVRSRWAHPDVDPCGKRRYGRPRDGGYGICGAYGRVEHYIRRSQERDLSKQMVTGDVDYDALWPLE